MLLFCFFQLNGLKFPSSCFLSMLQCRIILSLLHKFSHCCLCLQKQALKMNSCNSIVKAPLKGLKIVKRYNVIVLFLSVK